MRSRSNIVSTLRKRRRTSFLRKTLVFLIWLIVIFSLFVGTLYWQKVRIENVSVSGDSIIPEENILQIAKKNLEYKYLYVIPTDNIALIRRTAIKNDLFENYKKIKSVKISFMDLKNIDISISDREIDALWCQGNPAKPGNCFFMDKDGFVFSDAVSITGRELIRYFGFIAKENPLGETFFERKKMDEIKMFVSLLEGLNMQTSSFYAKGEYEVYLSSGGRIILDDGKTLEKSFTNLKALVDNGYIKTNEEFLRRIDYIDLRFGDKVSFKLK